MIVEIINYINDEIKNMNKNGYFFEIIDFEINFLNKRKDFYIMKKNFKNLIKYEILIKDDGKEIFFILGVKRKINKLNQNKVQKLIFCN